MVLFLSMFYEYTLCQHLPSGGEVKVGKYI